MSVLLLNILYGAISLRILEIHINIRHGNSLRVKKSFKKQIVFNRINIRDSGTIAHPASRRRSSSRAYPAVVRAAPVDIIPHDKDILYKAHGLYDTKLIVHICMYLFKLISTVLTTAYIFLPKALLAKLCKEGFGTIIALWHLILWNLVVAKLKRHIASVGNFLRILNSLYGIWEKCSHLLFALYEKLSAIIAHPVLVRHLLPGLDAQKHIMCLRIGVVGVVHIISTH